MKIETIDNVRILFNFNSNLIPQSTITSARYMYCIRGAPVSCTVIGLIACRWTLHADTCEIE